MASGVIMVENSVSYESELREQLEAARMEAAENHDKHLRALAECENMRKRLERICEERLWQQKRMLLNDLLELKDQLEHALQYADMDDPLGAGIRLTYGQVQKILSREGVQALQSLGTTFDPRVHEAVDLADEGGGGENEVTLEYRAGYTLDGKLLRPARVQVSRER
jgi:molecular chaperone GrpE